MWLAEITDLALSSTPCIRLNPANGGLGLVTKIERKFIDEPQNLTSKQMKTLMNVERSRLANYASDIL